MPPRSYAAAAAKRPGNVPYRVTAPGYSAPGNSQGQGANPFSVPRTLLENAVRIYARNTRLDTEEALAALEDQLGVTAARCNDQRPEYIDAELMSAEEVEKTAHRTVRIGGEEYRVGPAFHMEARVVTVILSGVSNCNAKEAVESLSRGLGQGASILTATHGSPITPGPNHPDDCERVYLWVDPNVRMCDVVPRVIEAGKVKSFVYWYNAAPICGRCKKTGHSTDDCRGPLSRPTGQGPPRPANRRARRHRSPPPAPAAPTSPRAAPSSNRGNGNNNAQLASGRNAPATEGQTADAGYTVHTRREDNAHGAAAATNHLEPPPSDSAHPEPENTSDAATVEMSDERDTAAPSEASGDEGQSPATNNQPESEPELDATPTETGDARDTSTPAAALEDEDHEDPADREIPAAQPEPGPELELDATPMETGDACDTPTPIESSEDERRADPADRETPAAQPESGPELELDATPMETGDACDTPTPVESSEDEQREDLADRETPDARDDERAKQHPAPPTQTPHGRATGTSAAASEETTTASDGEAESTLTETEKETEETVSLAPVPEADGTATRDPPGSRAAKPTADARRERPVSRPDPPGVRTTRAATLRHAAALEKAAAARQRLSDI
jgi:hypothetical protein